jgi:hypothetical protein
MTDCVCIKLLTKFRNTTGLYPLIPQVMNGTGILRQFVPRPPGITPERLLAIGRASLLLLHRRPSRTTAETGTGNKEEPTVPARVFVPMTDIYETANALAVVKEIEAGPKGGPPDDRRAGFNFPCSAKPRGRLPSDTALPQNDCSLASDRLEASPSRS